MTTNEPPGKPTGIALTQDVQPARLSVLRSLRHANYRRYFLGQAVSLIGTWMQQTALAWLVLRMTGDAFLMGANTFVSQIPALLLMPIVGASVDRWNRLSLVRITQTLAMAHAFFLAFLVLTDAIAIWQVMALALSLGCVSAFDLPARQALLPELLEQRADLGNAIALNSSLFNGARLVGPALAAILAAWGQAGEGLCFLLNGISYLAVLFALAFVRVTTPRPEGPRTPLLANFREGLCYVGQHGYLRVLLLFVALVGFIGMPYTVLVPVFAKQVLNGEVDSYGWLLTASGVGALIGAFYLAGRPSIRGSTSRIFVASIATSASLSVFACSESFPLSLAMMLCTGMTMMLGTVSCNTIIQSLAPDSMRGRIMSLFTLCFNGFTPLGALAVGWLAREYGPMIGMLVCSCGCLCAAGLFFVGMPTVRKALRVYLESQAPVAAPEPVNDPTAAIDPEEMHHG